MAFYTKYLYFSHIFIWAKEDNHYQEKKTSVYCLFRFTFSYCFGDLHSLEKKNISACHNAKEHRPPYVVGGKIKG